jgi:hypothetical protein
VNGTPEPIALPPAIDSGEHASSAGA